MSKPRLKITSRLPTIFPHFPGMAAQANIRVNGGRLRAKLVVFNTPAQLRRFWKARVHDSDLGKGCLGAVSKMSQRVIDCGGRGEFRDRIEADARYFCIIGLVRGHLTTRIVCHESVHAGIAYLERKTRNDWDKLAARNDEEALAYPVGEIARGIVGACERFRLFEAVDILVDAKQAGFDKGPYVVKKKGLVK